MRLIALAVSLSLLTAGCASHRHPVIAYSADGLIAGGMVSAFVLTPALCQRNDDGPSCVGFATALAGVVMIAAGAGLGVYVLVDDHAHPPPPEEVPPPTTTQVALPPLPDLATDPQTLALAHQARMAAVHRQCTAVRLDLAKIDARDHAYHDALVAQATFAACR